MHNVKDRFPFFANNPEVVYLDSAATTQKPQSVIDAVNQFYIADNANPGRSSHPHAAQAAEMISDVRAKVGGLLNCDPMDVFFNRGATDGFNQIALSLALQQFDDGDEVLLNPSDHKSFIEPWYQAQRLLKRFGRNINIIEYSHRNSGGADIDDIITKLSPRTRVINITHIHNVFGADSDIDLLADRIPDDHPVLINVDATQSIGHMSVDVQRLGCDLLTFSGHKVFATQGVGATFVSKAAQDILQPLLSGGGVGRGLELFEVGTLNCGGIASLGAAIDFIDEIGTDLIHERLALLTQRLLKGLRTIPGVQFTPGAHYWTCLDGFGIISFSLDDISSSEVGFILADNGIYVRTGDHCMSQSDELNTIRVSMHIYNSNADVDQLLDVLRGLKT